jgi:hypothetical protein
MFDPREVSQWYSAISEEQRREILANVPNSVAYNLTKCFVALSSAGQMAVVAAYEVSRGN